MSYAFVPAYGDTTVADPQVKALQAQINTVLSKNGYNPITTDGKWGPATCGALTATVNMDSGATMAQALNLVGTLDTVCTADQTAPTKKGSSSSVSVSSKTVTPVAPPAPTFLGLPMKTVALIALGAVGVVLFTGPQKKGA